MPAVGAIVTITVLLLVLGLWAAFVAYAGNGRLIGFAQGLDEARVVRGGLRFVESIEGSRGGRRVELALGESGRYDLRVAAPRLSGRLVVTEGVWLTRLLGFATAVRLEGEAAERLAGAPEVEARAREALAEAAHRASMAQRSRGALFLEDGWLTVPAIRTVPEVGDLVRLVDALARVGEALDEVAALAIAVSAASRDHGRCPYCREEVAGETRVCGTCDALHHAECWAEHGGCSVFGCAEAPRPGRPERTRGRA